MEPSRALRIGEWVHFHDQGRTGNFGVGKLVRIEGAPLTPDHRVRYARYDYLSTCRWVFVERGFHSCELLPWIPTEEDLYRWSLAELSQ